MPVQYGEHCAWLKGICSVEEAEQIYEWLMRNSKGVVDLGEAEHLHAAVFQVLLALRAKVRGQPQDPFLACYIKPLFKDEEEGI
jgi:hypothetical protein